MTARAINSRERGALLNWLDHAMRVHERGQLAWFSDAIEATCGRPAELSDFMLHYWGREVGRNRGFEMGVQAGERHGYEEGFKARGRLPGSSRHPRRKKARR